MSRRLSIAIGVSVLAHLGILCFLLWVNLWQQRRAATLSEAGGVVWFNLHPGGSGSGGEGGMGAPEQAAAKMPVSQTKESKATAPELPKTSPKEAAVKTATAAKKAPLKVNPIIPTPAIPAAPKSQAEAKPAGWPGPGQGDEAGGKTGPGGGTNEGLGEGQGAGSGPGKGPGGIGLPGTGGSGSGGAADKTLAQIRDKIARAKRYPRQARAEGLEGVCGIAFEIQPDGSLSYVNLTKSSGYYLLDDEALATVRRAAPFPYYAGPIRFSLRFSLKDTM